MNFHQIGIPTYPSQNINFHSQALYLYIEYEGRSTQPRRSSWQINRDEFDVDVEDIRVMNDNEKYI